MRRLRLTAHYVACRAVFNARRPFAHSTARGASTSFLSAAFAPCSYAFACSAVTPSVKKQPRRNDRRNARASVPKPFVQIAKSLQEWLVSLLVNVRVSAPLSPIANGSAPILVCSQVSATPSPIARVRAAESRPLTPVPWSTQATCAPLLVPVRVSVLRFPLARALATEPRWQVTAVRAAPSTPVLRAGPPVAPVPRALPPPPTVQSPKPSVSDAHRTKALKEPFLIDLRVAAPLSRVGIDTSPSLSARAVPPLVQDPASDQQHSASLRKKAFDAVRIVDGNAQSQCSSTAYGEHGATVSETRERRKPARSQQRADVALASIALSSSAATIHHCTATRSRRAKPKSKRI